MESRLSQCKLGAAPMCRREAKQEQRKRPNGAWQRQVIYRQVLQHCGNPELVPDLQRGSDPGLVLVQWFGFFQATLSLSLSLSALFLAQAAQDRISQINQGS